MERFISTLLHANATKIELSRLLRTKLSLPIILCFPLSLAGTAYNTAGAGAGVCMCGENALAKLIIIHKIHTYLRKIRAEIKFYHEVFIIMLVCACLVPASAPK